MNILRLARMSVLFASFVLALSAFAQSEDAANPSGPTALTVPTPLNLINGWTNPPYGTSNAEAVAVNGIVHLKDSIEIWRVKSSQPKQPASLKK